MEASRGERYGVAVSGSLRLAAAVERHALEACFARAGTPNPLMRTVSLELLPSYRAEKLKATFWADPVR